MYKVTYRCFGPFQHVHEQLLPDSVILQMHHLRLQTHETGYDEHQSMTVRCVKLSVAAHMTGGEY